MGGILSGPGRCRSVRIGSSELLPLDSVHLDRQHVGQRRVGVAARAEAVEPAQHDQPGAVATVSASSASSSSREGRRVESPRM